MLLYLLPGTIGCDTNTKLTAASAKALSVSTILGQPCKFVFRYVSLGSPSPGDITRAELGTILDAGLCLGLVQHVRYPGWTATSQLGGSQGKAAANHALAVGYTQMAALGLDLEGVKNSGQDVEDYVCSWAGEVHQAGYQVLLYVGYECGLSQEQLGRLGDQGVVDLYWSDFGPRTLPAGHTFVMKQHVQTVTGGVTVDPDSVQVAGLGVMAPDSMDVGLPHYDPVDVKAA